MRHPWAFRIVKFVLLAAVALALFGVVVMLLWNALIPGIFGGPALGFWQAVGLLVLSHILLRGWSPWRFHNGWKHDRWRKRFAEKLDAMTPEEREKFRADWRHYCGIPFHEEPGKQSPES